MNIEIKVSRSDFRSVLKKLKIANKPMKYGEAVISFDSNELCFQAQGVEVQIHAEGYWPGKARVSLFNLNPLLRLLRLLPAQDPILIRYQDNKLFVQSYTMPCIWQDISPEFVEIPIDIPWTEILKLRYRYTEPQLISSGIMPKLVAAEDKLNNLIIAASKLLKPAGISEDDLHRLAEKKLRNDSE